jgi:uncharacterized repeat protein (TIGR01451 family)
MRKSNEIAQPYLTKHRFNSKRAVNYSLTAAPYAEQLTISLFDPEQYTTRLQHGSSELFACVTGTRGCLEPSKITVYCVFNNVLDGKLCVSVIVLRVKSMSHKATIDCIKPFLLMLLFAAWAELCQISSAFAAPANDNFANATLISGAFGNLTSSNLTATAEAGEPVISAAGGIGGSVWYKWVAPASGTMVMGTCNLSSSAATTFDTMLGAYTGATVGALTTLAANDDTAGCNSTVNAGWASTISFAATSGTTYFIKVDGYSSTTPQGNFTLYWGIVGPNRGIAVNVTDSQTTEGLATDLAAFTVALTTVPQGSVTVTIGTSAFCTFAPSTLTFTPSNWSTPQTITATAVDDVIFQGTHTCSPSAITAAGGSFNTATATPPVITVIDNEVASFTITKAVNTANISAPGTLSYTVTVVNTGNVALNGPAIADTLAQGAALTLTSGPTLSSGDNAPLGILNAGETWIYNATYAVTQANINNGASITNKANFATTEAPVQTSNTVTTTITRTPQLTVVKTPSTTGPVPASTLITYTYKVTNSGNVTMTNVAVTDTHNGTGAFTGPNTETLLNDNAPLGDSTDAALNGTWDTLAPGDVVRFTATYAVSQHDVDYLQ